MTKKDYHLIGDALAKCRPYTDGDDPTFRWLDCVESIADALAVDNEHFNRELFIEHCKTKQFSHED